MTESHILLLRGRVSEVGYQDICFGDWFQTELPTQSKGIYGEDSVYISNCPFSTDDCNKIANRSIQILCIAAHSSPTGIYNLDPRGKWLKVEPTDLHALMTSRSPLTLVLWGGCYGLAETGEGTLEYEFRKGQEDDTLVLGYTEEPCMATDEIYTYILNAMIDNPDESIVTLAEQEVKKERYGCKLPFAWTGDRELTLNRILELLQLKFAVDGDTVEVHPYILVCPEESNPVFGAIDNTSDSSIKADIWADFNGIIMPRGTTSVIAPHSQIHFNYSFTTPDLPSGCYPCTFYVAKQGESNPSDSFTQPCIRITNTEINATFRRGEIEVPEVALRGQKVKMRIPFDVKSIPCAGGEYPTAQLWTIKDRDEFYKAIPEGVTIVDDAVWPIMDKYMIGISETEWLSVGQYVDFIHTFTIPIDIPLGKHKFETFFGKYNDWFAENEIFSGYSFDMIIIDALSEPSASVYIDGVLAKER